MPQLPDPSGIRARPASVALGELAIAAGLVGESVTVTSDFPASTLCEVWKYYTQTLSAGNVIHIRAKKDLKDFDGRIPGVRAVFLYTPRLYHEVAWSIQMAGSADMSPRPAVFCGFPLDDPDSDPGVTLPLVNDEREVAAVLAWAASENERRVVEVDSPSSVDYDARLATVLDPSERMRIVANSSCHASQNRTNASRCGLFKPSRS